MYTLHRIAVPAVNATFITLALLYLMFLLIKSDEPSLSYATPTKFPPFINTQEETELRPIIPKPPLPIDVEPFPVVPKATNIHINDPIIGPPTAIYTIPKNEGVFPIVDRQLILAIGYPPRYPSRAIAKGIEGYAVVGFSVDAAGAVFDAFIIESDPKGIFDKSALSAISKFKYKPRVHNGKGISTDGQRYMFSYKLDD